ncbi:MAG TPA: hypothetical protein VKU85_15375, partial [bacterium]|nr:hypothetical protein [bacterium]
MTPLNRAVRTAASVGVAAALATVGLPGPSAGAGPPEAAPGPVLDAPAGLAAALAARDTTAYLRRLDAALAADLVARLPADERPDIPAWDVGLVARSLQPGSALLALLPDDDRVWAALVRPDGVVPRRLNAPHVNALGPRLVAWAEDPAARPLDRRAALTLHNNLLVPFQEELSDVRHLVVAASGVLRTLPFEILLMAPADDDQPVSGLSFQVRRFELAYEPTIGSRLGWSGRPGDVRRV